MNVRSGICQWMQITISRERERNKSIYLKLMSYMDCNCGNSCTVIAVSIILIIILTLSAPLRGIYIESRWKLASAGRKRADRELLSQTFINLQKWLNYQWLCRILFNDLYWPLNKLKGFLDNQNIQHSLATNYQQQSNRLWIPL